MENCIENRKGEMYMKKNREKRQVEIRNDEQNEEQKGYRVRSRQKDEQKGRDRAIDKQVGEKM